MRKSDEIAGPSCLTKAADDEPLFVLRANDEIAPDVVLIWAHRYIEQKTKDGAQMTTEQLRKAHEALGIVTDMRFWKSQRRMSNAGKR